MGLFKKIISFVLLMLAGIPLFLGLSSAADGLVGVGLTFCDFEDSDFAEKSLKDVVVSPGDDHKLCYILENTSDEDIEVGINFVDGQQSTSIATQTVCKRENQQEEFGQYVTDYDSLVTIPANGTIQKSATINMPFSQAGTSLGCLTVLSSDTMKSINDASGGVVTVLRKATTITLYVDQDLDVGLDLVVPRNTTTNLISSDVMYVASSLTDDTYTAGVGFKNIGDLPQSVTVEGSVTDFFGNVQTLSGDVVLVQPKSENSIVFSDIIIPWYKLSYTVDLKVTHHATSKVRSEFITDDLLSDHTILLSETFFVFPWWLVIAFGALILLIWIMISLSKKSKKRHQHEEALLEELKHLKANKAE